jgi:hypothetical protein
MKKALTGILLFTLLAGTANAALLSRLSGQAYYDDVLDITWLADANYAKTSGYDADGQMTWTAAQTWIGTLNTANYLGVNDWRLPTVTDTGTSGCNYAYTGTDCGYNVDLSSGEMAHLFYSTLGNTGYFNTSGAATGCAGAPNYCLTNTGPFLNLQPNYYWSGTEYAPSTSRAWDFYFDAGGQYHVSKTSEFYAWAVRPGDIAPVPVPGAAWLLGGALTLLGAVRRRAMTALG